MKKLVEMLLQLLRWSKSVERSRAMIVGSSLIGVIAGVASTALIAVLNNVLSGVSSRWALIEFSALCALIPVAGAISKILMVRLTSGTIHGLQVQLCSQILNAPYRLLEELGPARLLATITDDIPAVTAAIANLPLLITQFAILTSCLLYLGWLCWPLLFIILGYMFLGFVSYQLPLRKSVGFFRLTREARGRFFKATRGLIEGNKELKLNREFRNSFLAQEIRPALDDLKRSDDQGTMLTVAAAEWGQILFFIFIGAVVFITPHIFPVGRHTLSGYTLTVLFMASPLITILNAVPIFGKASIALETIVALGLSLKGDSYSGKASAVCPAAWRRLDLRDVTHLYRREESMEDFCLGPMDITFWPGELVFVVGGNGSGKSTLAKILVGLYEPSSGYVAVDGEPVTADNRDDYRQRFSAVFSDFYLFERLYGLNDSGMESRVNGYLDKFHLEHKVSIQEGKFSTIELSQGQRKRLALLAAFVQDRPIYVFDEWASDQDPMFKQVFYCQILPEIKSRGKTVIVISHDDHYYHVADRIIKLEFGQVEADQYHNQHAALPIG